MEPKVSVVIPVYNVEKYIDECLTSVVNQTYKNLEIILVDDGSSDLSGKICDAWKEKDERIQVIHKNNAGLGMARNSGLNISTGDYVCFFDSDDYVEKDTINIFLNEITDCDVVYCNFIKLYNSGNEKICRRHFGRTYKKDEISDVILNMIGSMPADNSDVNFEVSSCMAMYSKNILDKNSIRFHSERELISEDLIFNIDYLKNCQAVKSIDACLYHYRYNLNSLTNRHNPDRLSMFKSLYTYINDNYYDQFDNNELVLRNKRTFIGHVRVVLQEITGLQSSNKEKIHNINNVCGDELVRDIINSYPYNQNPFKLMIFNYAVKRKYAYVLLILCKIRGWLNVH